MVEAAVRRQVPALRLGGDRHLGNLASAGGTDQVDDEDLASPGEEFGGVIGELELHAPWNPLPGVDVPDLASGRQSVSDCCAGECDRAVVVVEHGDDIRSREDGPQLERQL